MSAQHTVVTQPPDTTPVPFLFLAICMYVLGISFSASVRTESQWPNGHRMSLPKNPEAPKLKPITSGHLSQLLN